MNEGYRHLFGPVPSRRFGRSLGVDLLLPKTCSFDCIFCQLGRTTNKTMERKEYVPVDDVLGELKRWLTDGNTADVITLAGSGEPTLNTRFGEVIDTVHEHSDIPVVLLTNGTTLGDAAVRADAAKADIVKVSLSAWDQPTLERMNRPCSGVHIKDLVKNQVLFRNVFSGQLWLEVFLVCGINSLPTEVADIAALVNVIGPDRVHLNTAVRPPAEGYAHAVPRGTMDRLAGLFSPPAFVTAEFSSDTSSDVKATEADVLATLRRRPCTVEQLSKAFGRHPNEIAKYIGKLLRTGEIHAEERDQHRFYTAAGGPAA